MRCVLALLAASLPVAVNGAVQLLPAGEFSARDGRPGNGLSWRVSDVDGQALAARISAVAAKTPIVIDYDHQTLHAEKNGAKALAAGWIKSAQWRAGEGLFAQVEWTAAAKAHIEAGEYRYISPVLEYENETGRVANVLLAALVNYPALLGMEPALAHLSTQLNPQEESTMDLKALIELLGLPADTTEAKVREHLQGLVNRPATVVPAALAGALGVKADADEATAVAALNAIKGGGDSAKTQLATLSTEFTALKAQLLERDLQELLDDAIAAKKITPAERASLVEIGKKDFAWLKAHIEAKQPIPGLDGQSQGEDRGGARGGDGSAEQQAAALSTAALAYQAEQAGKGITITTLQAIDHVSKQQSK